MGYWIHNGAALSKPEAASSLSVRLSMAIPCSSPPTCAVGSSLCCCFLLLLKVLSKSSSKSKICSRTGQELRDMH
ncbi:hypothetical protein ACFXTH_030122 [Malus domestica]